MIQMREESSLNWDGPNRDRINDTSIHVLEIKGTQPTNGWGMRGREAFNHLTWKMPMGCSSGIV